jgi:hypothetical protein
MNQDLTVIYYTSNKEKPEFEKRIIRSLRHVSRPLPIISVSQKPMDFGKNICVGDVGVSNYNAFRQLAIGAAKAKTKFVCTAESDFLYHKEYFKFIPSREDVFYTMHTVYMIFKMDYYRFRRISEGAMVVGRKYLLKAIKEMLKKDKWGSETELNSLFLNKNRKRVKLQCPIITFKTKENMHQRRHHVQLEKIDVLPHWGSAKAVSGKYI